jgi:hypothetical protein
MSKTYTKPFGRGHTSEIIVESVKGMVIEHPSDTVRGGGYGRKHPARFPALKAWSIGRDLRRAGYREVRRG